MSLNSKEKKYEKRRNAERKDLEEEKHVQLTQKKKIERLDIQTKETIREKK